VLNGLKKYPDADYWELCRLKVFKNETVQYVPKLLAVAWIFSNHRRYGIEPVWPDDPQWIRVPVGRSVDLGLVAEHAGLSGPDLKKANGELSYGITPPDPGYHIKVPAVYASAVVSVLEDSALTLIRYYFHLIRSGDTLSGIARSYGVTESQIRGQNPGLLERSLKVGQRLIIPALKEINTTTASSSASRPAGEPSAVGLNTTAAPDRIHLVKRGETLWSIARAYRTKPETLALINGLGPNDILKFGSTLKIPNNR
jgi:membrane-bound lytic murein transglycosylase D